MQMHQIDEEALLLWERIDAFKKSVSRREKNKKFIFYEGPPTANGVPGIHHVEARSFKDVILRYKTMKGYFVPRRAGWDTHGLPVEVQVEKELGLKSKKDIEAYGIGRFNKKCRESVWKHKELWEVLTEKMGFWIDMDNPYITYENNYIESLWAVIKKFHEKNYLYKDYKIVPWCARCGTALSSHEVAQGYETVKDNSVYVKFLVKGEKNTYFLVWTTTPWTLPGNGALAINEKLDYVYVKKDEDILILAEARVSVLNGSFEIIKKIKGIELVGTKYKSLDLTSTQFDFYKVVSGNFVTAEDGTGIVHIAPAFGEDDFKLAQQYKEDVGFILSTGEDGLMNAPRKPWDKAYFSARGGSASGGKNANKLITEDLKKRGLLFKEEIYEHEYPFCWRCKEPLIYLARDAWWVDVNKVRTKLKENNKEIHWHPDYLRDGRFGGWLKEEKNWAFSRERYWGTPLPVWQCDKCKQTEVIGSLDELKKRLGKPKNNYIVMRHGEALNNVKNTINSHDQNVYKLTENGKKEVESTANNLNKKKIKPDIIVYSPFLRTKETAHIVAEYFGVKEKDLVEEKKFQEVDTGIFDGKRDGSYHEYFANLLEKFTKPPPDGETLIDVKKRVYSAISEIDNKYENKTILIVTHEYVSWMIWALVNGSSNEEATLEKEKRGDDFLKTAGYEEIDWILLPRDDTGAMDFHRPYIDEILFDCKCGGKKQRVPEVVDVWFDSGSMPFAQSHWPFEKKIEYPADYITEAIDQTRGWFYSLLAIATLLGKKTPYKNVISLGLLLDAKGKKMSKSLGNIVDPIKLIEEHGADAVRWYFFTINQPWDSKNFKEADIKDASRRFFTILWNIFQFWKLQENEQHAKTIKTPKRVINQWVLTRLQETINEVTEKLDAYDIVGAARGLEYFVTEDVSRWYIRQIRKIVNGNDVNGAEETRAVLKHTLFEIIKMLAPFAPFMTESIYQELGGKHKSVHWEDFVKTKKLKKNEITIVEDMKQIKRVVSLALEKRAEHGLKVRQPIASAQCGIQFSRKDKVYLDEIKQIIFNEVNAKSVIFTAGEDVEIDHNLTQELIEEGMLRDIIREIQSARKKAGLTPKDKADVYLSASDENLKIAKKHEKDIQEATHSKSLIFKTGDTLSAQVGNG